MSLKVTATRLGTIVGIYAITAILANALPVSYWSALGESILAMLIAYACARYLDEYLPPLQWWGVGLVVLGTASATTLFITDNVIAVWTWQSILAQSLVLAILIPILHQFLQTAESSESS